MQKLLFVNRRLVEGSRFMGMLVDTGKRFFIRGSAIAAIVTALSVRYCPAQQNVIGSFVMTSQQITLDTLDLQGGNTNSWMLGQSVNLIIAVTRGSETFQVTQGQGPGELMALNIWQWPQFPTDYSEGPPETNINLSNFHYIDAKHIGFTATVTAGASTGVVDQLDLIGPSGRWVWPIFIEPKSPPPAPGAPSGPTSSCNLPSISSVIPDTWIAGKTYPIKIMGSGFSSDAQAAANPNCPANQLTVTVPTGSVTVSGVHVVSSTEIDATVAPANTDPAEQATLYLYYHNANDDVIIKPSKLPTKLDTGVRPQDGTPPIFGWDVGAQANAQIENPKLYLINPYKLSGASSGVISSDSVIDALAIQSMQPSGIIADGTSTAIAVYGPIDNSESVTFSVNNNGASLIDWDPNFLAPNGPLNNQPVPVPLTVSSSELIQQGTHYYAFALLTAGTPSNTSIGTDIIVTATSTGHGQIDDSAPPVHLFTFPVPVLLVHGLWGNQSSLASTEAFLRANTPLSMALMFIRPICYSTYLAYYASVDTLPGVGTGCEQTSSQAITNNLSDLYVNLDANNIVGGRVDVVAHSMGGLVARYYSTLAPSYVLAANGLGYKNIRNRNQGTFRDIVTLDTPETGSELAFYLDNTFALKKENYLTSRTSDALWAFFCRDISFAKTLGDCLAQNRQPLAYPGHALTEGAVYSLIPDSYLPLITSFLPGSSQFGILPDPNIDNSSWYAVAGNYEDNGQAPQSLLRYLLNTLVAATYPTSGPNPETPMTLEDMFNDPSNDVIVTRKSQLYKAHPGHYQTFQGLAHTSIPYAGTSTLLYNNGSVTKSETVNETVAHWLGYH
jgi:hypothetical protein